MPAPFNATLIRHTMALTQKAFADIPEEQMRMQPAQAINPPVWILGHLCMALDGALALLGEERVCPPEYRKWFGPGSKLESMPSQLPTKKDMLAKLGQIAEMILATLPNVTPEQLAKPNPTTLFVKELPTVRDFVENLLFPHHMLHVGQVTVWRRLMGLPSVINL